VKWQQCILVCADILLWRDGVTRFFASGFFSWIIFPQAFEIIIRIISNVYKNFRRYSQVKVHHLYQWHRRYRCCCCYRRQIFRGEPSGNKFRNLVHQTANPQICGQNLLYLRTFRMCGNLQICNLWTQYFLRFADPHFFANLKLLQIRKFIFFSLPIHT